MACLTPCLSALPALSAHARTHIVVRQPRVWDPSGMRPSPGVALHFLLALSVSCLLAILAGLQASNCARGTRVVDLSFSSLCSALAYGFVLKSPPSSRSLGLLASFAPIRTHTLVQGGRHRYRQVILCQPCSHLVCARHDTLAVGNSSRRSFSSSVSKPVVLQCAHYCTSAHAAGSSRLGPSHRLVEDACRRIDTLLRRGMAIAKLLSFEESPLHRWVAT